MKKIAALIDKYRAESMDIDDIEFEDADIIDPEFEEISEQDFDNN